MDIQPLLAHLIELRRRLVRVVVSWLVCFLVLFHWRNQLYTLLAQPMLKVMDKHHGQMANIDTVGGFMVPLKVAMMTSFLLALPMVLYQIWAFIAPGLYKHEKRLIAPLIIASTLLFACGMAFCYFLVFPVVFEFLGSNTPEGVVMMTDIGNYLDFVLGMFLAFGSAFEVPVLVVILVRIGVVRIEQLVEWRRYMIVAAFVVAAVVTPPDVVSQLLLAIPLCVLYELGILFARFWRPKADEASIAPPI